MPSKLEANLAVASLFSPHSSPRLLPRTRHIYARYRNTEITLIEVNDYFVGERMVCGYADEIFSDVCCCSRLDKNYESRADVTL